MVLRICFAYSEIIPDAEVCVYLYLFPHFVAQAIEMWLNTPKIRRIFAWKLSNWFIAFAWGSGLAPLGIAIALASLKLPYGGAFQLAYAFFVAALVYSIGCWLTSDTLQTRDPDKWNRQRRRQARTRDYVMYRALDQDNANST